MISVIIPALNAQASLGDALGALTPAAIDGLVREVIVIDAGSTDATAMVADDAGATVVRGGSVVAAAAAARQPWLLILNPRTRLLPGWEQAAQRHMAMAGQGPGWFFAAPPSGWARLKAAVLGPPPGCGWLVYRQSYLDRGGLPGRARRLPAPAVALTA